MLERLSKDRIVAGPGFNRWLVPPASIAIHLCIGSVYAWSIYNPALVRAFGVVTPAADDWFGSNCLLGAGTTVDGLSGNVAHRRLRLSAELLQLSLCQELERPHDCELGDRLRPL
jgi:hypothetical protein